MQGVARASTAGAMTYNSLAERGSAMRFGTPEMPGQRRRAHPRVPSGQCQGPCPSHLAPSRLSSVSEQLLYASSAQLLPAACAAPSKPRSPAEGCRKDTR